MDCRRGGEYRFFAKRPACVKSSRRVIVSGMRIVCLLFLTSSLALASNWPQFRGPHGDGHARTNKVPVTWSESQNVKWKAAIHGKAWSSPVVWGNQIWLTTATPDAKQLFVLTVDAKSGKVIRDTKLFDVERPQFIHAANSPASPTPVVEEGRVYVTFGSPGTDIDAPFFHHRSGRRGRIRRVDKLGPLHVEQLRWWKK